MKQSELLLALARSSSPNKGKGYAECLIEMMRGD